MLVDQAVTIQCEAPYKLYNGTVIKENSDYIWFLVDGKVLLLPKNTCKEV